MKTVSTLKGNNKLESPKTPGGISKTLLTPCRRVGLSRNWKKAGPSPFVSPLSGNAEVKQECTDIPRKRKQRCDEDTIVKGQNTELSSQEEVNSQNCVIDNESPVKCNDIDTTPSRNLSLPQRKKSKTLITSKINQSASETPKTPPAINNQEIVENATVHEEKVVTTPVRTKSKSRSKNQVVQSEAHTINCDPKENIESTVRPTEQKECKQKIPEKSKSRSKKLVVQSEADTINCDLKENIESTVRPTEQKECKQKSPENLTKECIVVIQKKIFKKDLEKLKDSNAIHSNSNSKKEVNTVSQALFDSDSDDVPLNVINKNNENSKKESSLSDVELKKEPAIINLVDDDDDFAENTKVKVKKLEDKTTSTGGLQSKPKDKKRPNKIMDTVKKSKVESACQESKPSSQCSFDDDEDFVMDKKTILIRKCYNKVTKPIKAKSTGSITQRDIDDLKARIEMKKKLLLAKAMTQDTEELRNLIKKWQKGCQDALMELMELMKLKFPDKQNMDYSEILQTLKIPATMVGYDEENDSFITPTDENIILSNFNDF